MSALGTARLVFSKFLFILEHSMHLKIDISRVLQGCLKDVPRVSHWCFKGVLVYYKVVLKRVRGCFNGVSRVNPGFRFSDCIQLGLEQGSSFF